MANVYALVQACSGDEVRVVSVENNCIKFTFAAVAMSALCWLGGNGAADAAGCDTVRYNVAARAINATMRKHGATLEVSDPARGLVRRFDVHSEMPCMPEVHHDVRATIAIYGELLDVGGMNPNAHIQSDAFDGDVVLDVGREDARKLAQRLYSQVGVNASVTVRDGRVVAGKVLDVLDYAPEDVSKWLPDNEDALGVAAFRGMDISSFIAEQRI